MSRKEGGFKDRLSALKTRVSKRLLLWRGNESGSVTESLTWPLKMKMKSLS